MPPTAELNDRIQSLEERLARLRAEKSRLVARASLTERRREKRRKIIIGEAVLAAVGNQGVPHMQTDADLVAWLDMRLKRPHDRAVFDLAVQEPVAPSAPARP